MAGSLCLMRRGRSGLRIILRGWLGRARRRTGKRAEWSGPLREIWATLFCHEIQRYEAWLRRSCLKGSESWRWTHAYSSVRATHALPHNRVHSPVVSEWKPGLTNDVLGVFCVVCYEIRTTKFSSRLPDDQTACSLPGTISATSLTGRGFGLF